MDYISFLKILIDDGIDGAKKDYADPKDENKLKGSIAGFEACRDKQPHELVEIYFECSEYAMKAFASRVTPEYWWFRCYVLEVEFVLNVVSAMLQNEGKEPLLDHLPTVRGTMRAAAILSTAQ